MLPASIRTLGRTVLYRTPLHATWEWARRRAGTVPGHRTQAWWDTGLSGALSPYLGGTLSVDVRNAVTAQLVRHAAPGATALLDVGCAAGALAAPVRGVGIVRYVGVDISRVAIDRADAGAGEFHVSDLHSFDPVSRGPFDVVVLNEVLYYSDVDEVLPQMERYARSLTPQGVLVVSMKDDPKSRAILDLVAARHEWVAGVLFQEQRAGPAYRVRADRERTAYLVGVLRPRSR